MPLRLRIEIAALPSRIVSSRSGTDCVRLPCFAWEDTSAEATIGFVTLSIKLRYNAITLAVCDGPKVPSLS